LPDGAQPDPLESRSSPPSLNSHRCADLGTRHRKLVVGGRTVVLWRPRRSSAESTGACRGRVAWLRNLATPVGIGRREPHTDSCDGIAGTQGWSSVVLQAGFYWKGPATSLFRFVNRGLSAIGWHRVPLKRGGRPQVRWWLRLNNGKEAIASLDRVAPKYPWGFLAIAPPIGKPARGC
jgi:hypothetical protein